MNTYHLRLLAASFVALTTFSLAPIKAQTSWNNGGDGISWVQPLPGTPGANWTNGVPTGSTDATINVDPDSPGATDFILINSEEVGGQPAASAKSLTLGAALTGDLTLESEGGFDTLTINGAITNLSSHNINFDVPMIAGAPGTYGGGSAGGSLNFNTSLDLVSSAITMTGMVIIPGALENSGGAGAALIVGDGTAVSTVVLSGSNTNSSFTGAVTINANGTLQLGDGTTDGLYGSATGITDNGTLAIKLTNPTTDNGAIISGTGGLLQEGAATFTLTAANTFSGNTSVTGAGALDLQNSLALQKSTVTTGGTGIIFDSSVATHAFTFGGLGGSANLALLDNAGTPNAVALTVGANNGSTTYSGILSGTGGSLTKVGTGTLTLSNTNTFTGGTTITGGTLSLGGSLASAVAVGTAGTLSGAGTVNGNATMTGSGVINFAILGNITGTLGVTGGNWNGGGTVAQTVTSSSGVFTIGSAGNLTAPTVNVTGGSIAAGGSSSRITGNLDYTSTTASNFGGVIAGAGNTVTMNSPGTILTLSGTSANTYTGLTSITGGELDLNKTSVVAVAGNLTIGNNTGVANSDVVKLLAASQIATTSAVTVNNDGKLDLNGKANTVASLASAGGDITSTAAGGNLTVTAAPSFTTTGNTIGAGATVTSATTATLGAAATLAVNGSLADGLTIGNGTVTGTGSITGASTLNGGTITLGVGGNFGSTLMATGGNWNGVGSVTGAVTQQTSGTLNIGTNGNLTTPTLNVTGGMISSTDSTGKITGSVHYSSAATSTFAGAIAGTGNTLAISSGGLILTGTSNYTGATSVTGGSLALGTGGNLGATTVTVASGANLVASGATNTILGGGIVLTSGSNLNLVSGGINTLNTGTLAGTGTLDIDLGSTGATDKITLSGTEALSAGAITVNVNGLAGAGAGTYTFVSAAGGLSASDFAQGTASGTVLGDTYSFSGSGTSVTLTIVAANGYYFTDGAADGDFNNRNNYQTQASSGSAPTNNLSTSSTSADVFLGATSPMPAGGQGLGLSADASIDSLNFTASGAGDSVTGGHLLTIGAGGVSVAANLAGNETFSTDVALGSSQTWTVNTGSTLIDSPGISGTGFGLTKAGAGTLILQGTDSYTGATVVSAGALNATGFNSLVGTSGITVGTPGVNGAALQLSGGQTYLFASGSVTTTLNGTGIAGAGALEGVSGISQYSSPIILGSNTTIGSDIGSTLKLTGTTLTDSTFALTLVGAGNGSIANAIGNGAGTLTVAAGSTSTWTLTGLNTFTGATTISSGTLAIGAGGTLASSASINIAAGATFDISNGGAQTIKDLSSVAATSNVQLGNNALTLGTSNPTIFAGVIADTGSGSIVKMGSGVLTLTGENTYGGGTTFNGGEVSVPLVDSELGTGNLTFGGGELLTTAPSMTSKTVTLNSGVNTIATSALAAFYNGAIGGTGNLTLGDATNTGTIILTANNNYGGTTTIAANTTAQLGAAGATGTFGTGAVTDNGTINFNKTSAYNYTNATSGGGKVVQSGTGTTTITASNGYTGGTTITGGAISVASVDINLGTGNLTLGGGELITTTTATPTNKTVTLNAGTDTIASQTGFTAVYNGVISGTGALTVGDGTNTGTVVLGATNTYGGGTTVSDGTLKIGTGSTTGSVTGNILDNAAVVFNHSGSFTYAGAISGSGTVTNSQGTLVLSGTNTYSGATTITAGTLQLSGSGSIANSALALGTGTTLATATGATSNAVGALTVDSGTVNLQNSGTNTLNGSTLTVTANGGTLSIDVGATAGASDLVNVGAATFNGTPLTINIDSLGNVAIGTHYTFMTAAGGGLLASDFNLGALTGTLAGMGDTVTFGISGNSAFLQINGAPVSTYFYTGATSTDFTDFNNYNTGASNGVPQSTALSATSSVTLGTTAPTPTNLTPVLNTNLTIKSLAFASSNVTLSGTGTLTVMNGVTVLTGAGGTETISAPVALGATQPWLVTDAASTLVDSGGISGTGFGLTKTGAGTLVLSGTNTYTGATTITTGIVNLQSSGALNGTSGVTVASGTALQLQNNITTAAAPLSLIGTGVGGKGALENVSGTNNYAGLVTLAGATTIGSDAGMLNLTNVGTITGSGFGLTLAGTGNGSITSIIGTVAGGVTKTGAGTWTLNGANTFAGATTINAGTLALGATGSLQNSSGVNLANSGTTFDISSGSQTIKDLTGVAGSTVNLGASALTFGTLTPTTAIASTIVGTGGSLVKDGAGIVTLSGTNTYSGGTTFNGGVVKVAAADTNLGTGNLIFSGGELVTTTTSSTAKTADIRAGTNTIAAAGGTTATYNGALGGIGSLTIGDLANTGTVILNSANTFHGATIAAGTVEVGDPGALGIGDVSVSGTLETTSTSVPSINVTGNYTQSSSGKLVLNVLGGGTPGNPIYQSLDVTGTATLGGALQVIVSSMYVPVLGDPFTFVQANSIMGNFSSVTSNLASLQITTQGAGIIISQLPFATLPVSYTPNQLAVAQYVDTGFRSGTATPGFQTLLASLNGLTGNTTLYLLPDAFSQLSPEKFANFTRSTTFNNLAFTTQQMDSYFEGQRSADGKFITGNGQIDSSNLMVGGVDIDPSLAPVSSRLLAWSPTPLAHGLLSDTPDPVLGGVDMKDMKLSSVTPGQERPFNTFVMGNVVLGQGFSQADVAHSDTTTGQVQIGADYRITPHLRAGALFGYSHTDADLDNNNSKATIDSYSPGVYASFADHGWYANLVGTYGFNNFTENRSVAFGTLSGVANGAPSGDQIVGNLDGGYDFHVNNWTFGPTLGVQYVHLDVNSYTEDGLDAADLSVAKQEADSLRSRLGAHVSYLFQAGSVRLTPHLDASWQHEFLDQGQGIDATIVSVGGAPFSVKTPNPSRDSALIDAGLSADLNGQVTVFGDYAVQAGQENYFGQSVQAGVKIGF